MKDSSKWFRILIFIIPFIIIPLIFSICGINIKDFIEMPIWAIIWIVLASILTIPIFFLQHKTNTISSQKKQKRLFIAIIFFIVFLIFQIIKDINNIHKDIILPLWHYATQYLLSILLIATFLYSFFRIGKKQERNTKETEE